MLTAFVIPRGEKIQDGICLLTWCTSDEYKNDQLKGVIGDRCCGGTRQHSFFQSLVAQSQKGNHPFFFPADGKSTTGTNSRKNNAGFSRSGLPVAVLGTAHFTAHNGRW
jgi:hypothetical protein